MDWDDMLDAKYVDESGYAMYGDEEEDDGDDAAAYAYLYCDSGDWREVSLKQRNYTILKEGAVRQRLDACMSSVSWALSIPRDSAFKLLRHVNRSIRNVDEAQIAGEDEACKALGALGISTKAKTAEGGEIMWCPAPGCDCAIEFLDHGSGAGYDVTCSCSYNFCWNCGEEAHRPVDCETVSEWIKKKSAESENMKLILADSKPCPQCKRPVEKSQGGRVHMICSPPCKNEFCWVCLGEWSDHTGGLYACNRYEGAHDESLRRYAHYYERWATHESSRQKAVADLQQVQTVDLPRLGVKFWEPELALQFILEAWLQVVECRRVLKWSYVYGYYLPEQAVAKRHLLEYLQGEAEVVLERLHQCADKAFHTYLDASQDDTDNNFRSKLAGLTRVTRNYFDNLVSALEKGLSEVRTHGATSEGKGPTEGVGGRQMCLTDKDAPDNQLC